LKNINSLAIVWRSGNLNVIIPDGVAVSTVEQLDLQGKVISRTALANVKNSIRLNPLSRNSSAVSLVRLKTDRGDFTCKLSSMK
jgi:hypothetical protein